MKKLKILVVEDEEGFIKLLKRFFSKYDVKFEVARECSIARKLLIKKSFDFVICDYALSNETTIELVKKYHKKVNFYPNSESEENNDKLIEAGCIPIKLNKELSKIVRVILR